MFVKEKISLKQKLLVVKKLSRWRQHVPYTLPLVIAGTLLAVNQSDTSLDWRLLFVTVANILAMTFAFMINDVVDAPDDALDPIKTKSNVISQGLLNYQEGYFVAGGFFFFSAILFFLSGWLSFLAGISTLILSYAYSAPPLRLKARPIVDVLSHILMLSSLIILSGYLVYDVSPDKAWWVIVAVTMASAYGQFYNQLDDFETDKRAKLRNTAMLIGKRNTVFAMILSAVLTVASFGISIILGIFPTWLGWVLLVTSFTLFLFRWDVDMRGNEADASGMIQQPILIGANVVVFIWLLSELGFLGIG